VRISAYVHALTLCKLNKGGYWTQIYEILTGWLSGGESFIQFVILSAVVECRRIERRRGVSIFPDMRHKSVTIATSLERAVAI